MRKTSSSSSAEWRLNSQSEWDNQEYSVWPEINPALLAKCHGELRQNLSSLSPFISQEAWSPLEVKRRGPADEEEIEFRDLSDFYSSIRSLSAAAKAAEEALENAKKQAQAAAAAGELEGEKNYAQLLQLPAVFFKKRDFDVTSVFDGQDPQSPFLLAKFSFFLDTIELELVKLASRNSDSFFVALSEIKTLHGLVHSAIARVHRCRQHLSGIDESLVRSAIMIPQLQRRRENMRALYSKMELVRVVMQGATRVDELMAQGQFAPAIDLAEKTALKLSSLTGVTAVRDLQALMESKMDHMKRSMDQDLVSVMAEPEFNQTQMERVCLPVLEGFVAGGRLSAVWQEVCRKHVACVVNEFSNAVMKHVDTFRNGRPPPPRRSPRAMRPPSALPRQSGQSNPLYIDAALDSDDEETVRRAELEMGSLGVGPDEKAFLRSLKFADEMELLKDVMAVCLVQVEKLKYLVELLQMVVDGVSSESEAIMEEAQESLDALCELVHTKVSHILESKAIDNAKLDAEQFSQLFQVCNSFIESTEELCGRQSCHSLRGCLMTQAKGFLNVFHASQLRTMTAVLEAERWVAVEVPSASQLVIDEICGQPPTVASKLGILEEPIVRVGERKFHVVAGVLKVTEMIVDYLQCLKRLPLLAVDVTLLLKTFLKAFNDKCRRLILGHEARDTVAQLKTISSKNLALCSESVSLIGCLIAPIRAHLGKALSSRQQVLLDDYSMMEQEYLEHKKKIFAMLVNVMRQMMVTFVMRMPSYVAEWGAFPDRVSDYVTVLIDKTKIMHRMLSAILNPADLQSVLDEVLRVYNSMLAESFRSLELRTKNQRKRLRNDVSLLTEGLKAFEGVDSTFGMSLSEQVGSQYPI